MALALLASCSPKADPNAQIQRAVAATLAAIPSITPAPTSTLRPTSTPFVLSGVFCEYEFCIGHPAYANFFDKTALDNPEYPSAYQKGTLTALSRDPLLLIIMMWAHAPGVSDPQFILDTIVADETDTLTATVDHQRIRDMDVLYAPLSTIISPDITKGAAAAWICGDRVFAWKVYAKETSEAETLFKEAINRFDCKK